MRYEYRVILMDDPLAGVEITPEQKAQMIKWWNEALDRSMAQIFEGKTDGR